ncbi:MAG: hypothetical protein H7210_02560 [Pyrinomonadaceae bacterium]|nr:hypothetical protein [Phycisphaerales bacterium]
MRTSIVCRVVSGCFLTMLAGGTVWAQTSEPGKAPDQPAAPVSTPVPAPAAEASNAAKAYEKIWDGPNKAIFEATFLRTTIKEEARWLPDADATKKLEAAQADIEALIAVTKMEACDWNVRTKEEGFDAKVPHWTKLATTARVFFADARRLSDRAATGDDAAAAERIASIIRLSQHFKNDKLVGSVRTGRQQAAFGMVEAKRLAIAGKLDEAARKSLLEVIKPLDNTDPLDMKAALLNESVITREWTKQICVGPNAAKTFIAKFAPKAKQEEIDKSGLNHMDETALHRQIDSLDLCYQEVVASWDLPNASEAIKSIDLQRKAGDYGGPAVVVNADPGFAHHRSSTFRFVALVKDVIKSVNEAPLKAAK